MFQRVTEFHRAFEQLVADTPALPTAAIRQLRQALLTEEVNEFIAASEANDRVEMADALADICYIIAGTCVSYGIGPSREMTIESPYVSFDGQPSTADMTETLNDCLVHYMASEASDDLEQVDMALAIMLVTVFGVAWQLHMPLNAIFDAVHRSNMSKLMPDGSILRREDGKILKSPQWAPPQPEIAALLGM